MNEQQIARIRAFLGNTTLQETIKKSLTTTFMKKRETDTSYLAAQMLAIQLLEEGWRDLESHRTTEKSKLKSEQIGL